MKLLSMNSLNHILSTINDSSDWLYKELIESKRNYKPTSPLIEFLLNLKLNLALVPKKYGGLEFNYLQEMELIRCCARHDANLGFIVFQLCGNVGRVLSFLSDEDIINLLENTEYKTIICYQDNFSIANHANSDSGLCISGDYPLASLSNCATHFVLPYTFNNFKYFVLVSKEAVTITSTSKGLGLKATSTTGYKVENYCMVQTDIQGLAVSCNSNFLPRYSIARSPVKHAAWFIGVGECLLNIRRLSSTYSYYDVEQVFCKAFISIKQSIAFLDEYISKGLKCDKISSNLIEKNRYFGSWLLELAIETYLANPKLAIHAESDITSLVCDLMTLALHSNVRETRLLASEASQSIRTKLLLNIIE